MADVWAKNAKGDKRRFTETSWLLLGNNKCGWDLCEDHIIHNVANKTPLVKPNTGQTKSALNVTTENVIAKKKVEFVPPDNEEKTDEQLTEKVDTEKAAEFKKAATGISSGKIKDFFEKQNPVVIFDNKAKNSELIIQLGEYFKNDIVEFQKAFSI